MKVALLAGINALEKLRELEQTRTVREVSGGVIGVDGCSELELETIMIVKGGEGEVKEVGELLLN